MNTFLFGVLIISVVVFVLYAVMRARWRAQRVQRVRAVASFGAFEISARVFYVGLICSVLGLLLGVGLLFSTYTALDWGAILSVIGSAFASHYLSDSLACKWADVRMIGLPNLTAAIVGFLFGLVAISVNALFHG